MIGLGTTFWLMVCFFALIGTLRGWTKEVIATSGLVLSLFALNQFGFFLVSLLGATASGGVQAADPDALRRQQFYILTFVHLGIAFFSYQGPAIAGRALRDRLRVRDSLQDKVLGAIVGALNGYLIVGTIWAFLEYQVGPDGYVPLAVGVKYPFAEMILTRPPVDSPLLSLITKLPLPLLAPYLPFLVVVVFLFVIVVMI
ncbi:MAG: CvpA family protein [Anaerolineae bacterium]